MIVPVGDFVYRFAYLASEAGAKYGKQETRPAKIRNPNNYGFLCKHLSAMLINKKWMREVAAPVMDWFVKRIDDVNRYLKVKWGEELTLPNEIARRNALKGRYAKMFDEIEKQEKAKEEVSNSKEEKSNNENNENKE